MLKVIVAPDKRNDGRSSCAAALRFNSSYFTGAWLKRKSKNASVALTFGGIGESKRCTVVKSGAGNGAPRPPPPPPPPVCPAPPRLSRPSSLSRTAAGGVLRARPDARRRSELFRG